jgi:hypothetical protein
MRDNFYDQEIRICIFRRSADLFHLFETFLRLYKTVGLFTRSRTSDEIEDTIMETVLEVETFSGTSHRPAMISKCEQFVISIHTC